MDWGRSAALALALTAIGGCASPTVRPVVKSVEQVSAKDRYSFAKAPTEVELAARRVAEAIDAGNTKLLLEVADPEEVRLLHLSAKNLQPLVDYYKNLRGDAHALGITDCSTGMRQGYTCTELVRGPRTDYIVTGSAYPAEGGSKSLVVVSLVQAIHSAQLSGQFASDADKLNLEARLRTLQDLDRKMSPKGLAGMVFYGFNDGKAHVIPWSAAVARTQDRINAPDSENGHWSSRFQ